MHKIFYCEKLQFSICRAAMLSISHLNIAELLYVLHISRASELRMDLIITKVELLAMIMMISCRLLRFVDIIFEPLNTGRKQYDIYVEECLSS